MPLRRRKSLALHAEPIGVVTDRFVFLHADRAIVGDRVVARIGEQLLLLDPTTSTSCGGAAAGNSSATISGSSATTAGTSMLATGTAT